MANRPQVRLANPQDYDGLGAVMFDAIHNGQSLYSRAQRQGLFARLYEKIKAHARRNDIARLWTHASLMAQPAFGSAGFEMVQTETLIQNGPELARAEMQKHIRTLNHD